jgi:hypothetical protein
LHFCHSFYYGGMYCRWSGVTESLGTLFWNGRSVFVGAGVLEMESLVRPQSTC